MARMSKIEQARWDGFNRACRVAKEQGVDGLLEEQKKRGVQNISVALEPNALMQAAESVGRNAIWLAINTSCLVLRDKFDFGHTRIQRFLTEYVEVTDSVDKKLLSYEDAENVIREETGIDFSQFVKPEDIHLK